MDARIQMALEILTPVVKALLSTPEGQRLLRTVEDEALRASPLAFLAALLPHDVQSIGFRKDGPG